MDALDAPTIVFVSPVAPASAGNGLAMRAGLFLEGLRRSGRVRLIVLPIFGGGRRAPSLKDGRGSGAAVLEPGHSAHDRELVTDLLSTPTGRERARDLYPLPDLCRRSVQTDRLRREVAGVGLVHLMRSYLAPCLDFLFDDPDRPPVTLDLDELDSEVLAQLGQAEQAERFRRLERYYLPRVDYVYVASKREAELVRREHGIAQVDVVTNAVWPPAVSDSQEARYDLLFVGNLSYAPNIDAVQWLCGEVRPSLGDATIAIVGSTPASQVRSLAKLPGVTIAGDVSDVSAWYACSRVVVAPLRIGGGSPTKTAEALAHGRPVVATSLGAGDASAGVWTADDARSFAAACRRLLDDPASAGELGQAGRVHVPTAEDVAARIEQLARTQLAQPATRAGT